MDYIKTIAGGLLGGMLVLGFFLAFDQSVPSVPQQALGSALAGNATTLTNQFVFTSGVQIGTTTTNRSTISGMQFGTCTAVMVSTTSLGTNQSAGFVCSATGVAANDNVRITLPAGAGAAFGAPSSPNGGFVLGGAVATSTGIIGFTVTNLTGSASSSFAQATTSVQWQVMR